MDWLLDDLCVKSGFCNYLSASDLLKQSGHIEADEFASTVLIAEGMNPDHEGDHFRGIRSSFTDKFGSQLSVDINSLGPDHLDEVRTLNNQAHLKFARGCYTEAEALYKRALAISEKPSGPKHPKVTYGLDNLARFYEHQGRHADAEPLYKRALAIWEQDQDPNHPVVATARANYAAVLRATNRSDEAEELE